MALSITAKFNRLLKTNEKLTTSLINQVLTSLATSISGVIANGDLSSTAVKNNVTVPDDFFFAQGVLAGATYAATFNAGLTAWKTGLVLCFQADAANAGACNLNPGFGAKAIKKHNGADLEAGDIGAGQIVCVRYNGTHCELMSQRGRPALYNGGSTTGTANALTVAASPATLTLAQIAGVPILAKVATGTNTGASTFRVNATAVKSLRKLGNVLLDPGDLVNDQYILVVYDLALDVYLLLSDMPLVQPVSVVGTASNLVVRSGTPSASRVTVTADELVVKTAAGVGKLLSAVNVNADLGGVLGAGGLDFGSEAANTWYYVWVIHNPTANITSGILSLSSSAPLMPADYTYRALVGVARNDGAGDFVFFRSAGREYNIATQTAFNGAANNSPTVATALDLSAYVPPNAKVVLGVLGYKHSTSLLRAEVRGHLTQSLGAQTLVANPTGTAGTDTVSFATAPFRVNLWDPQTLYWLTGAGANYNFYITGYVI